MKIRVVRYNRIGKYFRSKAMDSTIKELRDKAKDTQYLQNLRYKNINGIRYLGINNYGDLVFECNSEDKTGKYKQNVRFYDLKDRKPQSRDEVLDMLRNSDVGVSCNDPSFLYWGGAYNATQQGHNIFVENRGLNDPNKATKEKFTLCKHLIAVLQAVPFYWNNIVGDYKEYFKIVDEIEEEEVVLEDFTEEDIEEAEEFIDEDEIEDDEDQIEDEESDESDEESE